MASGALVAAARPPDGAPELVFVALVPLLLALRCGGWMLAALAGGACGLIVYGVGIPSMAPVAARLQGVSSAAASGFAIVFVLYHQGQFALAAVAAGWLWRERASGEVPGASAALAVAAAWALVEWAFPQVLPWALGSLLGPLRAPRQLAALGGAHALTFFVVLVNGMFAASLLQLRTDRGRSARCALLAGLTLLAVWVGGAAAARDDGTSWPRRRVAGVQGALAAGGDLGAANARAWETYTALTRPLAGQADLIVWPESTLRALVRLNPGLRGDVQALVESLRTPLLFGAVDGDGRGGGDRNAALLVSPRPAGTEGETLQAYHKLMLVPFGEYVPAVAAWVPGWRARAELVPGAGREVMRVATDGSAAPAARGVGIGPAICVEAIVPGWFNGLVRDGAQVLVNLTDDAWFADPRVAAQHLEMTRLRAVETRRWLVRASNSGISAVIDPRGEVVASLPYGAAGTLVYEVEVRDDRTVYVRGGEWVVVVSGLIVAAQVVARWNRG